MALHVNLKLIEGELARRRMTVMELYDRMSAAGWAFSWRSVYDLVRGNVARPPMDTIIAISQALDIPVEDLCLNAPAGLRWSRRG